MARMSRYLPLREYRGKGRRGEVTYHEVYGDPKTMVVHKPRDDAGNLIGWQGNPPNEPSGSPEREGTERSNYQAYREGWERIFRKGASHGG